MSLNVDISNTLKKVILSVKYIVKWSALSALSGAVVGLAAVIFTILLNLGIDFLEPFRATNFVYILPIIGLALSGLITSTLAPEAAGHGTDAIIHAYNKRWGKVNLLVIPVKLIASVVTIAFGGSAGREGPTVQMGGGLAYFIGKKFRLKLTDIRKLVICGMGASFGSIFTAPIAGGIFGAEVLYRDDLEYNNLFISFISSITAFFVYSILLGQSRLFEFPTPIDYTFVANRDILFFIAVGIYIGCISLIFIKSLYGYEQLNEKINFPIYIKTAIGGLLTGITALIATPYVLGTGMDLVRNLTFQDTFPTALILLMLVGKIAATSFTIGSGASGGVVAPSLTIGALAGAFLSRIVAYPHPIAIITASSVALLGSAAHIPITTTLLAAEIFGMEVLKPATIVCFIAALISKSDTLYRESYVSRNELIKASHKSKFTKPNINKLD